MNLHEYQSKRLFANYGIPVPRGIPILDTPAEVTAEINRARGYLEKIRERV